MDFEKAKSEFIQAWGSLGTAWGLNKTMAQIYALLIISSEPLSTEEIMSELKISRGNVNMNIRSLMDWGLAFKILKPGERKEHFGCEKDFWQMAKQVARERRKREIEPLKKVLKEIKDIDDDESKDIREFKKSIKGLSKLVNEADVFLDVFDRLNQSGGSANFLRLLKTFMISSKKNK